MPVLLHGAETWTMNKCRTTKLDAFDMWFQRRILRAHFSQHNKNADVRQQTKCRPLSAILCCRCLQLFKHIARADTRLDHSRALRATILGPSCHCNWKRLKGRPSHTWARTVEADLRSANLGLLAAWHRAQGRTSWMKLVKTAMPQ